MTVLQFKRTVSELNWAFLIPPQCGVASCAEGDPGIGKTNTLECLAAFTNRTFHSYELSRTQPEDLQGFPVVGTKIVDGVEYRFMDFVPDKRLLEAGLELSVLLLDEISNVIAPKQAPALNLVQNPPATSWMFMACNPLTSAADGQPLTCPFINRIWYGDWEVDVEAQDWGLTHNLQYPPPEVPLVPENFMEYQPKWGSITRDFMQSYPTLRNACPSKQADKHKAWPSSRQWHNINLCLAGVDSVGASEKTRDLIVMGLVGEKAGCQFIEYVNQLDLPRPEQLLKDAKNFEVHKRYDVNLAMLQSILSYIKHAPKKEVPQHFESAVTILERLNSQNGEIASSFEGGLREILPNEMNKYDTRAV